MQATRTNAALAILLCLLMAAGSALAGVGAQEFVRTKLDEISAILRTSHGDAREKRVRSAMDSAFDYDALAASSLGKHWQSRSPAEQREFTDLLKQLVRRSYRKSLDKTLGWSLQLQGERPASDGVRVATIAKDNKNPKNAPVGIDYVLHQTKEGWRVVDVVVEGSSLVANYRNQFNKVIRKGGFADLLSKMKRRLAKPED